MVDPLLLRNIAWALSSISELVLFVFLLKRRLYRSHPAFVFYIFCAMVQSVAMFAVYRRWTFQSTTAWYAGWGSQGLLTCARWLASFEVARRLLSGYTGIWALAKRVLLFISAMVLAYSLLARHQDWHLMAMSTERGLQLAIASFIVTLLLFARYYRIPVHPLERSMALGFFLFSCFSVVNYSLFENWLGAYSNFWNFLGILTFFASLLIWIYAVEKYPVEKRAGNSVFVSPEYYIKLSSQLNMRLRTLNDHLAHLLRSEDHRP
jgi:hypothetical protein